MKIRFVQLESDAFLTDIDFIQMSPAERGVYCSLIFFLTSNDGKCVFDSPVLSRLCNCQGTGESEKIWERISKKFQTRNGVIKHKRLTKELRRAKKFRKVCSKAGLKGARKRWHYHSDADDRPDGDVTAKGRKGSVIEKESECASNTNTSEQSFLCLRTRNNLFDFEVETPAPVICLQAAFKPQQAVFKRQGLRKTDKKKAPALRRT